MRRELTLMELLEQVHDLPWDHSIYVPRDCELAASTPIVLLNTNEEDWDDDADQAVFAQERGLRYLLLVQDAQMVVENLSQQAHQHSSEDRLRAFNFYRDHDAYIDFSVPKA